MTRPGPRASAAPAHVPRRSLGQHFLIDKNIVHKIVRLAELQPGETVLEIGPGRGILTDALLDSSGPVVAVELDAALCAHLRPTLRRRAARGPTKPPCSGSGVPRLRTGERLCRIRCAMRASKAGGRPRHWSSPASIPAAAPRR